ncbi:NAD(P)H-quinone oxidoreductase [Aquibacillus sediminis]|uniref:NAD(P)H-quinone oxidoreductase n=1 Tax=Aquibacillus sediminis TaxID=2574734 RepID=UPI001108F594|nr:NAD(P)H-quinone oxidoreductase [Aquibacillus sediminis]
MKAMVVQEGQLQVATVDKPTRKMTELLINVKAVGINRTDIISRKGRGGYLKNPILGVEIAGVVEDNGNDPSIPVGARVMGLVNGGAYAEYAVMPADRAMIIPDHLTFEQAAAIPEVFLTAYQTLFWLGNLQQNETVLIHAGGSGVGTAAIQLAKQVVGATVIITAGSEEKLAYCRQLGADYTINYKEQAFDEHVLEVTDQKGVDVVLDFIGASYYEKNLASLKTDGRWILIGLLGGAKVDQINLQQLMAKRIHLKGTLLTPRSDNYKAALTTDFMQHAYPMFSQQRLKPIVDQVFPLEQAQQAHQYMEDNKNIGKIILTTE